jgi:hypothetical protein
MLLTRKILPYPIRQPSHDEPTRPSRRGDCAPAWNLPKTVGVLFAGHRRTDGGGVLYKRDIYPSGMGNGRARCDARDAHELRGARASFQHHWYGEPAAELAPFVGWYWAAGRDLFGQPAYRQLIVPYPNVHRHPARQDPVG